MVLRIFDCALCMIAVLDLLAHDPTFKTASLRWNVSECMED